MIISFPALAFHWTDKYFQAVTNFLKLLTVIMTEQTRSLSFIEEKIGAPSWQVGKRGRDEAATECVMVPTALSPYSTCVSTLYLSRLNEAVLSVRRTIPSWKRTSFKGQNRLWA